MAALALFDPAGRLLLQQRPAGRRHAGLWEFPGGKVEASETPREALVREVAEELGIRLETEALEPAHLAEESGGEAGQPPIVLLLYIARCWRGSITPLEGQTWSWHAPAAAALLALAPMDRALLARLA